MSSCTSFFPHTNTVRQTHMHRDVHTHACSCVHAYTHAYTCIAWIESCTQKPTSTYMYPVSDAQLHTLTHACITHMQAYIQSFTHPWMAPCMKWRMRASWGVGTPYVKSQHLRVPLARMAWSCWVLLCSYNMGRECYVEYPATCSIQNMGVWQYYFGQRVNGLGWFFVGALLDMCTTCHECMGGLDEDLDQVVHVTVQILQMLLSIPCSGLWLYIC